MQLLIADTASDPDAWHAAFKDIAEDLRNAGLTQLQLWREPGTGTMWQLYEINDEDKARAYLDGGEAQLFVRRSGTTDRRAHFLETA